jgi:hypothetical protein
MRVLLMVVSLMIIPAVCFAHSGMLVNAVSNYWPFLVPALSGIFVACRRFFMHFFYHVKSDRNDEQEKE